MSVPAVMTDFHLEAEVRLIRWGESSSAGRTITLELHPDEGDGHPFKGFPTGQTHGQRFRVAFSAIGDDEQPACAPLRERPAALHSPRAGGGAISPKERYASLPVNEQAVTRAAMLPKDERFRAWVATQRWNGHEPDMAAEVTAEQHIRETCCFGESRKRIAEDPGSYDRFIAMETAFRIDVGELPEPR